VKFEAGKYQLVFSRFLYIELCMKGGCDESMADNQALQLSGLLDRMVLDKGVRQAIIVTTEHWQSRVANLQAFEKRNGIWEATTATMNAVVGKHGFTLPEHKKEGDSKSPAGIYKLGTAFGTAEKPSGLAWPYRKATRCDYWVDDPTSSDYNTWVHYTGQPKKRWKSFERLAITPYKYALVIQYNDDPIVPGKGSAIFMHIWRGPASYTAGCVALPEKNLLSLLRWLDPQKHPVIVQGPLPFLTEKQPIDA
jgi:L,D-peptidoglycan transpeptidase YkuD (ErfK/YbiS/YcfS/YnhG family)